ncbi:MAG: choice-of-anchor J domain-containing protein [Bacteroidia bacterium]|nr:choice-of-anchor J domain-containing protein [Bacteroidia bacterium]
MKKVTIFCYLVFLLFSGSFAQKSMSDFSGTAPKMIPYMKNPAHTVKSKNVIANDHQSRQVESYLFESFESSFPPTGWTKQNPDGGTGWAQCANGTTPLNGWNGGTQDVPSGGGNFVAYCTYTTGGTASNDQWLITPQFTVSSGDSIIFNLWWFGAYEDSLHVLISTTTNQTSAFTTLLMDVDTLDLMPMSTWKRYALSLNTYAGQNIYIAFREIISDNQNMGAYLALDMVSLGTQPANDVSSVSIDMNSIMTPGSVNPTATVMNMGSAAQTFNVTMNITGGYTSTKSVIALASMASQQVTL